MKKYLISEITATCIARMWTYQPGVTRSRWQLMRPAKALRHTKSSSYEPNKTKIQNTRTLDAKSRALYLDYRLPLPFPSEVNSEDVRRHSCYWGRVRMQPSSPKEILLRCNNSNLSAPEVSNTVAHRNLNRTRGLSDPTWRTDTV